MRVKWENIPEQKIIRPQPRRKGRIPYYGVSRFIKSPGTLCFPGNKRAVSAACTFPLTAKDHLGVYIGMLIKNHSFAGHGDTGKTAALISAGLGNQKDTRVFNAVNQIPGQLFPADRTSRSHIIIRVIICPGIKYVRVMVIS